MWRHFIHDYFSFTSKERKGILFIMCLVLTILLLPFFFTFFVKEKKYDHKEFEAVIALLRKKNTDADSLKKNIHKSDNAYFHDYSTSRPKNQETITHEEFYFDPNTATAGEWKRLGVRDKTIHTIQNYIAKGGRFYKPEDLAKIWGLPPDDRNRLIDYVRITKIQPSYTVQQRTEYSNKNVNSSKPLRIVDINLADTNAYISLPGIGSKLSKRIIAFREKLGGFYSIEQVGETYLLPDSTFQKIRKQLTPGNIPVKKININSASVDEMKLHPYLRYNIANAIFQYRQQHGPYKTLEELKKIVAISDDDFTRALPYLSLE